MEPCKGCGTLRVEGDPSTSELADYYANLWDLHHRRKSGIQHGDPLVFTASDFSELGNDPARESADIANLAMERDMAQRGLCPHCGLPDLRGLTENDFYTEEEAEELAEMYAEQAAERRAGC